MLALSPQALILQPSTVHLRVFFRRSKAGLIAHPRPSSPEAGVVVHRFFSTPQYQVSPTVSKHYPPPGRIVLPDLSRGLSWPNRPSLPCHFPKLASPCPFGGGPRHSPGPTGPGHCPQPGRNWDSYPVGTTFTGAGLSPAGTTNLSRHMWTTTPEGTVAKTIMQRENPRTCSRLAKPA